MSIWNDLGSYGPTEEKAIKEWCNPNKEREAKRNEVYRKIGLLEVIQIEYEKKGDLLKAQDCWDEIVRYRKMLER